MTICVIPARGGSVRIPGKNLKLFHGKPIIQYSIEAALGAGFDTYVSTDDKSIGKVALDCGAMVHMRSWQDPEGEVGTQEVTARVLDQLEVGQWELVVTLYATAPAVSSRDLVKACETFKDHRPVMWVVGSYPHRVEDCGAFYVGYARDYRFRLPLVLYPTMVHPVLNHIDINTPEDWVKYEEMFA